MLKYKVIDQLSHRIEKPNTITDYVCYEPAKKSDNIQIVSSKTNWKKTYILILYWLR